jgi:phospholipase A1
VQALALRRAARLAALTCGCALVVGALAQPDPAECTRIDDDVARLTCYDRAHKREPIPAGVNQPSPPPAPASAPLRESTASMFDDRWDADGRRRGELFYPRAYKPVYLLPLTWTDSPNTMPTSPAPDLSATTPLAIEPVELKYQISIKAKLWDGILGSPLKLWGAYTQSSRWQIYNGAQSRPFREAGADQPTRDGMPFNSAQPAHMMLMPMHRSTNASSRVITSVPTSPSLASSAGAWRYTR